MLSNRNGEGGAGAADVDDGETHLLSDVMDLTWYQAPSVEYNAWFTNGGGQGSPANDSLNVFIDNGVETVLLEAITENAGSWRPVASYFLPDLIEVTDNMRLIVSTGDYDQGHLVEAGFDAFQVVEGMPSSIEDVEGLVNFEVMPNPFNDNLRFNVLAESNAELKVILINLNGQILLNRTINSNGINEFDTSKIPAGAYILQISDGINSTNTKLIKQ